MKSWHSSCLTNSFRSFESSRGQSRKRKRLAGLIDASFSSAYDNVTVVLLLCCICYSVPVLLVIDEYNAFRSPGALKEWNDDEKKTVVRSMVDPAENEVASLFDWNTFRLVRYFWCQLLPVVFLWLTLQTRFGCVAARPTAWFCTDCRRPTSPRWTPKMAIDLV